MSLRSGATFVAALAAVVLIGCDKKVELNVYNASPKMVDVAVVAPPDGYRPIGTAGPHGKLKYKLKIDDDLLPAQCALIYGPHRTDFTITEGTPKKLFFSIDDVFGPSGPRDKNTEVRQESHRHVEGIIVEQYEVVE